MALSNNENKLKSILTEERFDIDTGGIWAGVKDQIPQESSRRAIPFWISLSGLIGMVSLIGVSFILLHNPTENNTVSDATILQNEKSQENVTSILNEKTEIAEVIEVTESNASPVVPHATEPNIIKNEVTTASQNTSSYNNSNTRIKKKSTSISNNSFAALPNTITETLTDVIATPEPLEETISSARREILSLASLSTTNLNLLEIEEKAIIDTKLELDRSPKIVLQKDRNLPLFYTLSAGSNYSFGKWNSTASDPIDLSNFDSSVAGISGSFTLGYEINRHWNIIGGISSSQSIYRYSNQSVTTEPRSEQGEIEIIIDSEGNPIPVNGTISTQVDVTNDIQWHRKHLYIDALLAVRYNRSLSKSWFTHIQGGANYSIFQQHAGYYRDDANADKIVKIDGNNSHPYAANPISFSSNIGIHKTIGAIDLSLNWGIRWNPFNQLNNNTIYTLKNSQTDLQLGITFRPGGE